MYVCCECGATFENLVVFREDRGECFGFPSYEEVYVSPCCYGDYAETFRCDCCGKWVDCDYIKLTSGERICENCYTPMTLGDED